MAISITNYRDLFGNVRKRPRMFLITSDFASVVSFVEGCDLANARGLLTGFQPREVLGRRQRASGCSTSANPGLARRRPQG